MCRPILEHYAMAIWLKYAFFSLTVSCLSVQASDKGGISVGGTRIIYPGGQKEVSLNITNSDSSPYLIQSWAEASDSKSNDVPFMVTPPLFRLDSNQKNLLRIVQTRDNLPNDRESLYWMNIKSIPTSTEKESENTLQIAIKTRIKLIYRPQQLKGTPEDVAKQLIWNRSGKRLTVNNPTAFIMNFQQIRVGSHNVKDISYVLPMSQTTFTVPENTDGPVVWSLINDYGGIGPAHLDTLK